MGEIVRGDVRSISLDKSVREMTNEQNEFEGQSIDRVIGGGGGVGVGAVRIGVVGAGDDFRFDQEQRMYERRSSSVASS